MGLTLHTFGAPGNMSDNTTVQVLSEIDNYKLWFHGLNGFTGINLARSASVEIPLGSPNYEEYEPNYRSQPSYLVIQVHPNAWDENRFTEFKKSIDFLIEKGVIFMNPYEYYQMLNPN